MKKKKLHIFSIHSSRHEKRCRMLQTLFWLFQCSRNTRWEGHNLWGVFSIIKNLIFGQNNLWNKIPCIIHTVWSVNDGAGRDLSKTLRECPAIFLSKKTKSVVFLTLNWPCVELEIHLIWAFCQKADAVGSRMLHHWQTSRYYIILLKFHKF